jgi:hypothetical protein
MSADMATPARSSVCAAAMALLPPGLALLAGAVCLLIALADAAGVDPPLRTGPPVWTCQHPW